MVLHMRAEGLLGRVLVSQDAGWFHVGEPNGGSVPAVHDDVRALSADAAGAWA